MPRSSAAVAATTPTTRPSRTAARLLVALGTTGALVAGCGESPVDMEDHPITTTPSRAAGEALQRGSEPEESCFEHVAEAETADPQRILALGLAAVDTACLLGLAPNLVGTSPLPPGAGLYLPEPYTSLPVVDPAVPDVVERARELDPDLIVLPRSAASDETVAALREITRTVVYDDLPFEWPAAVEEIGQALGRPGFVGDALLFFLEFAENVASGRNTRDVQVSLVELDGDDPVVAAPDLFGVSVLEASGAQRPPAQRAEGGQALSPQPGEPVASDVLSGDVVLVLLDDDPEEHAAARTVFSSARWQDLPPVDHRRFFVVDRPAWTGAGLVAARVVLTDIDRTIASHAPEG